MGEPALSRIRPAVWLMALFGSAQGTGFRQCTIATRADVAPVNRHAASLTVYCDIRHIERGQIAIGARMADKRIDLDLEIVERSRLKLIVGIKIGGCDHTAIDRDAGLVVGITVGNIRRELRAGLRADVDDSKGLALPGQIVC